MILKRHLSKFAVAGLLVACSAAGWAQNDAGKVLRIVPQSDLKILDPIWTTAFITRDHGYAVYDTLFGVDAQGAIHPQMVASHSTGDGGRVWTFTLRDGLAFHDGAPVTSTDVIASLRRWGQRDALGQRMLAALDGLEPVDAKTFRMRFGTPFGMVLDALAKPSSNPPFIMPARVAAIPADQQISDATGSGPFIFKQDEWRPGERVVYLRNEQYLPRSEPPSGTAGGKHVYVDRMEWVVLKDAQTQANALINGEVDMLEFVPSEQYGALKSHADVVLDAQVPQGSFALHLNRLVPPFNNTRIAQAAIMAVNQDVLLRAQMVHKELYNACTSIYPCGSAFASDQTSYFTGKPQFEKARALLKEAGYDGTPVVLMYPTDFSVLNKFPPVMAALLKQAGFNVDLQSMDWPTLVSRRASKKPASQGGWNLFITAWGMSDTMNPLFFAPMTGNGEKGWFGWTTDEPLEQLKSQFIASNDEARRKQLATVIQQRVFDAAVYAPIGEYKPLTAYRRNVSGLVESPVIGVYWNLKKN